MSPLRDRPDPVQSSIRRESALGWSKSQQQQQQQPSPTTTSTSTTATTPLRIAKRDSKPPFPLVARRSSSSYKLLRNNNLVSKSPFKSHIPIPSTSDTAFPAPTPTPRRVSGEKRPRPESMHEQAENERPFAFKRERRQSKAYQGLIEKEPVTKSPFRRPPDSNADEDHPPPPPPKVALSPPAQPPSTPAPALSRPVTPSRPSLVSKRPLGPRTADQSSIDRKRRKGRRVTFDERCDVLEFDREEEEEDPFFSSDEDNYGEPGAGEEFEQDHHAQDNSHQPQDAANQDSFESIQLGDGDHSITGIVDAMLQSASGTVPGLGLPSTPSRHSSLPPDLETEGGVPYGRSHHAERARRRASVSSPALSTPGFPFQNSHSQSSPSTPPRSTDSSAVLSESEAPHGPSLQTEHTHGVVQLEQDVNMIPPSPSPMKNETKVEHTRKDSLIPRFELNLPKDENSPSTTADPFSAPRSKEEPHIAESSFTSFDDPMDPANLSIVLQGNRPAGGNELPKLSELIPRNSSFTTSTPPPLTPPLSFAGASSGSSYVSPHPVRDGSPGLNSSPANHLPASPIVPPQLPRSRSASPSGVMLQRSSGSPSALHLRRRSESPLTLPSRLLTGSPALRSGSPLRENASVQELLPSRTPRTRISRDEIQARLMRKRSTESPLGSPAIAPHVDLSDAVVSGTSTPPQQSKQEISPSGSSSGEGKRPDSVSVTTDASAEFATIQKAEKIALNAGNIHSELQRTPMDQGEGSTSHEKVLSVATAGEAAQPRPSPARPHSIAMLETSFDVGAGLGFGARDSMGSVQLGEMRSALDRLMDNVKESSGSTPSKLGTHSQVRVESVPWGLDTSGGFGDESMRTETDMSLCVDESREEIYVHPPRAAPVPMERAATDSAIHTFRSPSRADEPPVSLTKDAIRAREELILEKRREARKRDEEESMGYYTPPRPASRPPSIGGRASRRRSRSTGDAGALTKGDIMLDLGISDSEDHLADSITRELRKLEPEGRQGKYRIREHEAIFASADADQVSHIALAGDVNGGKAWRTVRRPSDMNEYAKQIREYRSQEKPGKAHGKVFVRVLGIKGLNVPIPQQPTAVTCTLNNGIHFVTTPESRLSRDTRINQEFELIEHNKLEFTLTLKVRRDPHITAQFKALVPPPPPPQPAPAPKPKGGMFSFLSSSPKKPSRATPPPPAVPAKLPDNLARYLKQDGTLARALISFKDVAARCDTRLFEISYPLIGQRAEASGGAPTTMELGEIVLQLFRLPSLPGVLSAHLPQSLDECLRGLRHVAWHKVTYFEGTLTQNGGDCTTWRRRKLRVVGANLIAFNDVTKKVTATINLKKAIAVEDIEDARAARNYDGMCTVERSFRLIFPGNQEIFFFADTDEEKVKWLEVLRALVGHIPPNPLWAELIWQRQQEMAGRAVAESSRSS
ncbi:hypothetical protein M404DRAFT_992041 [Pisolithus tinctorius Marx 270]|uniref:PH domain-containing protein n=1 Tax=Pisolithus tinctorius Marx 270 TaxID=870435 RepID=A0A0C3KW63_PISTI|nr:hypothetical protein M404DRAFT_992041 [Pisolithus tinctorius Marx 270]